MKNIDRLRQQMFDIIKPSKGVFNLEIYEGDVLVHSHVDKNLIVDSGFLILSNLVATADSGKIIDTIALGSQGIVNNKFIFPVVSDVTLRNETFRKTGRTYTIDTINKQIEFVFTLSESEGNGVGARVYNEAGLYSSDGTMMARKVFPECVKTPNQKMFVRWALSWN